MSHELTQRNSSRGVMAVEMIVAVSIVAVVLIAMASAYIQFINTGKQVTEKTQALYLAEEGLELMRFVRDDNWASISSLTTGATYGLALSTTTIGVTTTPEKTGIFERTLVVSNVYRQAGTDDIVASTTGGAIADTNAKYVTVTVRWGVPTTTKSLTTILTHLDL